jgi:ubiquinone/menaquinone biosynthesis C-methylase UbiE
VEFSHADTKQKILELDLLKQLPSPEKIHLPYRDLSFDWVACHELIERYSTHERQVRLLRELLRIARKGVFISTVNRFHPALRWLKKERGLSLLTSFDIKALVDVLPGKPSWKLGHVRVMGFKAYYFLMIWKEGCEPEIVTTERIKNKETIENKIETISSNVNKTV